MGARIGAKVTNRSTDPVIESTAKTNEGNNNQEDDEEKDKDNDNDENYDSSSTLIRQRVKAGLTISAFVPEVVAKMIEKEGFYSS